MVISPWISMETNHQQWIHGVHPRSGDFPMEKDDLTYLIYLLVILFIILDFQNGSLQCPTCKAIHGIKLGNQPASGRMDIQHSQRNLPGHPDCGMITIVYDFRPGVQVPEFNKIKDINIFVYRIIEN